MKPIRLKRSNETNYNSIFLNYISSIYGPQSITPKLKEFFSDFNENRKVIAHKKDEIYKIPELEMTLRITTKYLNQLISIKGKTVIGPQTGGCDLEFLWTDTITGTSYVSHNVNFEYYNILFNIASLYFHLGYQKSFSQNIDKNIRKEVVKDYKRALYLFTLIKNEAVKNIEPLELPNDLSPTYCEYCITLCEIYGQIDIVKIAEETNPNEFNLRSKLLMGISDKYYQAFQLSNGEPLNKGGSPEFRNYLGNRSFYYKYLVYKKQAEIFSKKFDDTGLGYGEALVYQELSVQYLTECHNTINNMGKLVDVDQFNSIFNQEVKLRDKMKDLNTRIYHQFTPDPKTLKFESKIMMTSLPVDELYIGDKKDKIREDNNIYCEDLYLLTPHEIKPMLEEYKNKMNAFITEYLSKYENENSINSFINSLHLASKIILRPNEKNKENNFEYYGTWEKIMQIQNLGGSVFLSKLIKNILDKSNELEKKLNLLLQEIQNEENEDNYYRNKVGEKYVITPSKELNSNFIQTIKNYIDSIRKSREFDLQKEKEINEATKGYQELILSKEQFIFNIEKLNKVHEPLNEEEQKLRTEILKLYELEDKMNSIIDPILKEISTGSGVINFFAEVLANRMTERSIFDITKEKYLKQLEPIDGINNEIKNQIKIIKQIIPNLSDNTIFPRAKENKVNPYINNLENLCNSFNTNKEKLNKAENYYIDLENKIENLIKSVRGWTTKRKEEKKLCLGTFQGQIKQYDVNNIQNPFEGTNNQNNYNMKDYYSPYPNKFNNNNNIPQNNNINQNQNDDHLDQPYCSANIKK